MKKKSRRSVSIRGTTYERLRTFCADTSISMSDFVEERIAEYFHLDFRRSNHAPRLAAAATAATAPRTSTATATPTTPPPRPTPPKPAPTVRMAMATAAPATAPTRPPPRRSPTFIINHPTKPAPPIRPGADDPTKSGRATRPAAAVVAPRELPIPDPWTRRT